MPVQQLASPTARVTVCAGCNTAYKAIALNDYTQGYIPLPVCAVSAAVGFAAQEEVDHTAILRSFRAAATPALVQWFAFESLLCTLVTLMYRNWYSVLAP